MFSFLYTYIALHHQEKRCLGSDSEFVVEAEEVCKSKGALRTVPIRVSNAFHTQLMREMEAEHADYVNKISFLNPKCKLMINCKSDFVTDVEDIKKEIKNKNFHTVLWYEEVKKSLR